MPSIDEAFLPFQQIIERMLAFTGEIADSRAGVRSRIVRCEIESPVELDLVRDEEGNLRIGSTPPLYYVDTTLRPSYHKLSFSAELVEAPDGE